MLTFIRFGDVSTVTLRVGTGTEETAFQVHEDLLCQHSSFFKAAFTSQWKRNTERKIRLPEDDPDTFEEFIQWLYTQNYELDKEPEEGIDWMSKSAVLYVLADKYDVVPLKNDICKAIHKRYNDHEAPRAPKPEKELVAYVYKNTSRSSPLRKMLADWYTWHNDRRWFENRSIQKWLLHNPEIAVDLVVGLSQWGELRLRSKSPLSGEVGRYLEGEHGVTVVPDVEI